MNKNITKNKILTFLKDNPHKEYLIKSISLATGVERHSSSKILYELYIEKRVGFTLITDNIKLWYYLE